MRSSLASRPVRSANRGSTVLLGCVLAAFSSVVACDRARPDLPEPPARPSPTTLSTTAVPRTDGRLVAAPRPLAASRREVVAIGFLHGDHRSPPACAPAPRRSSIDDTRRLDQEGSLVVVQTGDEIDRGDDDRSILDAVDAWKVPTKACRRQRFIALLGNHSRSPNASLDFRYVRPQAFPPSPLFSACRRGPASASGRLDPSAAGRAAAFAPGGRYAAVLAARPLVEKVGGTLFVHGGVLPQHVSYERIE